MIPGKGDMTLLIASSYKAFPCNPMSETASCKGRSICVFNTFLKRMDYEK